MLLGALLQGAAPLTLPGEGTAAYVPAGDEPAVLWRPDVFWGEPTAELIPGLAPQNRFFCKQTHRHPLLPAAPQDFQLDEDYLTMVSLQFSCLGLFT